MTGNDEKRRAESNLLLGSSDDDWKYYNLKLFDFLYDELDEIESNTYYSSAGYYK